MSNVIKLLPYSVINQIAAGQVVHRPSSVVKEMMENAVDAGATDIKVDFRDGGLGMMTIADNGRGMSPEDARLAFERHSTSKIDKVEDLYALSTFGFRGEALASIAAVAEVEVVTREQASQLGTKIAISGGKFLGQESVSAPAGTRFKVGNLFYNTPAQRRFLDKSSTEERHIMAEFKRVALCHPSVAFALYKNDAPLINLPASTLKGRVAAVAGKHIASTLLNVQTKTTLIDVEGFVTTPEATRQRNSDQYFFVNGRFFKSAYFHKAVMAAYEKLIPSSTQPAYFIYLQTSPERIDVNIHPQKTDIKFDDQKAIWQIINASVRESLAKLGVVPMMDFDPQSNIEIPIPSKGYHLAEPRYATNPDFNPFAEPAPSRRHDGDEGGLSAVADGSGIGAGSRSGNLRDTAPPYVFSRLQKEEDRSILEYISGNGDDSGDQAAQLSLDMGEGPLFQDYMPLSERYVAANLGGQLAVVDIVRARESILFDKYRALLTGGVSISQRLLFPEEMVLSADDVELLQISEEEFSLCGFEMEFPDPNKILLNGIPADFTLSTVGELIYDMLDTLRLESGSAAEVKAGALAAAIARRGAAASGHILSKEELGALLSALEGCSSPRRTPSGKPVIAIISNNEIKELLT